MPNAIVDETILGASFPWRGNFQVLDIDTSGSLVSLDRVGYQ